MIGVGHDAVRMPVHVVSAIIPKERANAPY